MQPCAGVRVRDCRHAGRAAGPSSPPPWTLACPTRYTGAPVPSFARVGPMPLKAAIVPVTPFQQNCTFLWDEHSKRGVVVDPGGDLDRIQAGLEQVGLLVEKIILTHGHIDHAGGAAALKEKLGGIPIEGPHRADQFLLDGLAAQARSYGLTDGRNVTPDRWLSEGDSVSAAGLEFAVLHCPGHSPGSVVLVNEAQ